MAKISFYNGKILRLHPTIEAWPWNEGEKFDRI
jgi:hypothetical protein